MHKIALALVLALALAGCASASPPGQATVSPPPSPGRTALSIISTPFLIAFKIPVCIISAVMAGALVGAAQLGSTSDAASVEQALGEGLETNCGPPYVVDP
jgi:hypothetical protein